MIELFPAKRSNEILHCVGSVCGWALSRTITTPWLSMLRRLFWIAQWKFWSVAIDPCWLWRNEAISPQAERLFCPKTLSTWSSELKWSASILSLFAMKCASTRTAALIQELCATPTSLPLWLLDSRSCSFPHYIVPEIPMQWPAVSICVLP